MDSLVSREYDSDSDGPVKKKAKALHVLIEVINVMGAMVTRVDRRVHISLDRLGIDRVAVITWPTILLLNSRTIGEKVPRQLGLYGMVLERISWQLCCNGMTVAARHRLNGQIVKMFSTFRCKRKESGFDPHGERYQFLVKVLLRGPSNTWSNLETWVVYWLASGGNLPRGLFQK